jgi:hypothetical protein
MVQEQLTDYISSQMKLGVSRDAIKSALVSAGWVAGDVEDTLKKMEGSTATAAPSTASSVSAATPSSPKDGGPEMIRVSDLVSSPKSTPTSTTPAVTAAKFGGTIKGNSFEAVSNDTKAASVPMKGGSKGTLITEIVGVILILGLGGLAWYFYSGHAALASQVATLNSQSASVTAQLNTLQSQINASSSADASQIASLMTANADLALNLSFYAVPVGTPTSTALTPLPVTITGSISGGGKAPYAVTTTYGTKIFIVNSSDATLGPELKASLGQTAQLSGTYVEGSDEMTVSSIATTTAQ